MLNFLKKFIQDSKVTFQVARVDQSSWNQTEKLLDLRGQCWRVDSGIINITDAWIHMPPLLSCILELISSVSHTLSLLHRR